MAPLPVVLRNQLAKAIQDARRESEAGARSALQSFAVHLGKAHDSMEASARSLRGRLRAHGKQLGDARDPVKDTQEIDRLAHEVAYEHWHRMLFARFLAENNLLIEPEHRVAISMEECEELAREQGVNPWALAASYAQVMLPKIFRVDDPVLDVELPPEKRLALERILQTLPPVVFTADDSLGWTYQFWQTAHQSEISRVGSQVDANAFPAVTQLFTERYMVLFLFHNTIGAWRAGRVLAEHPDLAKNAIDEEELRDAARVSNQGGYDFTFLRFVRERRDDQVENASPGPWRPAAGTFDAWPNRAADLRVLDPCCGSGHFLVEGLDLLVRLRMEEDQLSLDRAVAAVIADNLFGLEVDARCTQIAAFNLAFAAWKLVGKPIALPPINIACSGAAVGAPRSEWVDLAGDDVRLGRAMERLYDLFVVAPQLGSLIDPTSIEADVLQADFSAVQPLMSAVLKDGRLNEEEAERAVAAQGMARAVDLLASEYTLVITNVPYLGRKDHSPALRAWADDYAKPARGDLATLFLSRSAKWCGRAGATAFVTSQNWLTMPTYRDLREALLTSRTWHVLAALGEEAWRSFGDRGPRAVLSLLGSSPPRTSLPCFHIDVSSNRGERVIPIEEKIDLLRGKVPAKIELIPQSSHLDNPDCRIIFSRLENGSSLSTYAASPQGIKTGDDARFRRCVWEVSAVGGAWQPLQGAATTVSFVGGLDHVIDWREEGRNFSRLQGSSGWGRTGVVLRLLGKISVSLHTGAKFDSNVTVIVPNDPSMLPALWAYCSSPEYAASLRVIEPAVKLNNATAVKVPFDPARWSATALELFPSGVPEPESDDPTQWLFHGHPQSTAPLQVAVARLLGYRWPAEVDGALRLSDRGQELVRRCHEILPLADTDGIVCLPSVRGEKPAADRLSNLLAASGIRPDRDIDAWLRTSFFEEHCGVFHHRPFIWHIWDGRDDGFHALLNYHRLAAPDGAGGRLLEALTYSYLGNWIEKQRADQRDGKDGADARLAAAQDLQAQLERIISGEPPCDVFIRWKALHEQPIGWAPDINDGVRLNIRPFMSVSLRKGGRSGAGILRWKPKNISWGPKTDDGNERMSLRSKEDFPWFWGCPGDGSHDERTDFMGGGEFDGRRWNDLHYSLAVKRAAKTKAGGNGN